MSVKALGLQEVDIPSLLLALGAFCAPRPGKKAVKTDLRWEMFTRGPEV